MSSDETGDLPVARSDHMPRWVWKAVAVFWGGALAALLVRSVWDSLHTLILLLLVSLFLSLAIEPGANYLARRGWRRGPATLLILVTVMVVFLVFVVAIAALVGQQVADLLVHSDRYVTKTVHFVNNTFGAHLSADKIISSINDPTGKVQKFITSQQGRVLDLSVSALTFIVEAFSVMLFTFYLVADGPKLRIAICSRFSAERQLRVLDTWELAIDKTGGYIYSRVLLGGLSVMFHWVAFQIIGIRAPLALALWVGIISQFLPVIGTYLAGALPVLVAFLDSPGKALIVLIVITVYVQIQDYVFLPRVTRRTMNIHPAIAFGSALAGAALLGAVGAVLAIPAAAMIQAIVSEAGVRHEVVDSRLTELVPRGRRRERKAARKKHPATPDVAGDDIDGEA
ncbi:MAG: AI-2E family transporter [Actinomycetota bacterium]